jgi:hypothetical protein
MAFSAVAADLKNINRYETRLRRSYDRALQNLLELRSKLPNEPDNPAAGNGALAIDADDQIIRKTLVTFGEEFVNAGVERPPELM